MKFKFTLLLTLWCLITYSQENKKIDSLNTEIQKLNQKIQKLKTDIQTEILTNGFITTAKKRYSFSEIKLLDKEYGKTIDTVTEGDKIKVLDRLISSYKVEYKNKIGYVTTTYLDVNYSSPINYIKYKSSRESSNKHSKSFNSSRNRSYSKSIKVKGHYRTAKYGKRVYVKPHTRKRKKKY